MKHRNFINMVNSAIDNFEKQGVFSKNDTGGCYYQQFDDKGEPTTCCIVGHMMPSVLVRKLADDHSGGVGIIFLYNAGFEWAMQFTLYQIYFMKELQHVHDNHIGAFIEAVVKMRRMIQAYALAEEGSVE